MLASSLGNFLRGESSPAHKLLDLLIFHAFCESHAGNNVIKRDWQAAPSSGLRQSFLINRK
jgi:hypothetical protein